MNQLDNTAVAVLWIALAVLNFGILALLRCATRRDNLENLLYEKQAPTGASFSRTSGAVAAIFISCVTWAVANVAVYKAIAAPDQLPHIVNGLWPLILVEATLFLPYIVNQLAKRATTPREVERNLLAVPDDDLFRSATLAHQVIHADLLQFAPPASTITPDGHMTPTTIRLTPPVQYPLMALPGIVTAWAQYSDHGRHDTSATVTVQATDSDGSFTIDWGSIVQGGHLAYHREMVVKHIPTGLTRTYVFNATRGDILGQNPEKSVVKATLGSVAHQVIAYKESRFAQFDRDGLPVFGPPNGFGVMQLDNSPAPTARQIWDWTENVAAGATKFEAGKGSVEQHYKNLRQAHPGLPELTETQLSLAAYQYYNGGFYWVPNAANRDWDRNPDSRFTAYGDDAARIEGLVDAGTPPPGWA